MVVGEVVGDGERFDTERASHTQLQRFGQEFSIAAIMHFYRATVTSSGRGGNFHSRTLQLLIHH